MSSSSAVRRSAPGNSESDEVKSLKHAKVDLVEEEYKEKMAAVNAGIQANNVFALGLQQQNKEFDGHMMTQRADLKKKEMDLEKREGLLHEKADQVFEKEEALDRRISLLEAREATICAHFQQSIESCIAAAIHTNFLQQIQVANNNTVQIHVGESGRVTTYLLIWVFVVSTAAFFVLLTATVSPSSVSPYNGRPAEAEPLKRATCLVCGLSTVAATIAGLFQSQLLRLVKRA